MAVSELLRLLGSKDERFDAARKAAASYDGVAGNCYSEAGHLDESSSILALLPINLPLRMYSPVESA